MDKILNIHVAMNFMTLSNIKVHHILRAKGKGKSFEPEPVFAKLGIQPIIMSARGLESGNAGEPAKLIRQQYREAADIIKKGGNICSLVCLSMILTLEQEEWGHHSL